MSRIMETLKPDASLIDKHVDGEELAVVGTSSSKPNIAPSTEVSVVPNESRKRKRPPHISLNTNPGKKRRVDTGVRMDAKPVRPHASEPVLMDWTSDCAVPSASYPTKPDGEDTCGKSAFSGSLDHILDLISNLEYSQDRSRDPDEFFRLKVTVGMLYDDMYDRIHDEVSEQLYTMYCEKWKAHSVELKNDIMQTLFRVLMKHKPRNDFT